VSTRRDSRKPPTRPQRDAGRSLRTLERRVRELDAALETERQRHMRQAAALRRAADRRVAAMVQEIAGLRHHEARAEALTRLLAERDVTLAALSQRIASLESLLQEQTRIGEM
jgi:hypothetical protein